MWIIVQQFEGHGSDFAGIGAVILADIGRQIPERLAEIVLAPISDGSNLRPGIRSFMGLDGSLPTRWARNSCAAFRTPGTTSSIRWPHSWTAVAELSIADRWIGPFSTQKARCSAAAGIVTQWTVRRAGSAGSRASRGSTKSLALPRAFFGISPGARPVVTWSQPTTGVPGGGRDQAALTLSRASKMSRSRSLRAGSISALAALIRASTRALSASEGCRFP